MSSIFHKLKGSSLTPAGDCLFVENSDIILLSMPQGETIEHADPPKRLASGVNDVADDEGGRTTKMDGEVAVGLQQRRRQ